MAEHAHESHECDDHEHHDGEHMHDMHECDDHEHHA